MPSRLAPTGRPVQSGLIAGLMAAAAPLIATATLAGSTMAGPALATSTRRALVPPNCSVASSALDHLKIPDCLGD